MKKACAKYLAWRAAKGMTLALVCSEINLVYVPKDTWWIDSGATTHINMSMQGCLQYRKSNEAEKLIMWAIVKGLKLEAIGSVSIFVKDRLFYRFGRGFCYIVF